MSHVFHCVSIIQFERLPPVSLEPSDGTSPIPRNLHHAHAHRHHRWQMFEADKPPCLPHELAAMCNYCVAQSDSNRGWSGRAAPTLVLHHRTIIEMRNKQDRLLAHQQTHSKSRVDKRRLVSETKHKLKQQASMTGSKNEADDFTINPSPSTLPCIVSQ